MLYFLLDKIKEAKDRKNGILRISFYKKNGNWYVDVLGFSEEDTILIGGSEAFLDRYCKGMRIYPDISERITLRISSKWNHKALLYLEYKDDAPEGYNYSLFTNGINRFSRAFYDIGGSMCNGYIMDLHIGKVMDSIFPEPPQCISIY